MNIFVEPKGHKGRDAREAYTSSVVRDVLEFLDETSALKYGHQIFSHARDRVNVMTCPPEELHQLCTHPAIVAHTNYGNFGALITAAYAKAGRRRIIHNHPTTRLSWLGREFAGLIVNIEPEHAEASHHPNTRLLGDRGQGILINLATNTPGYLDRDYCIGHDFSGIILSTQQVNDYWGDIPKTRYSGAGCVIRAVHGAWQIRSLMTRFEHLEPEEQDDPRLEKILSNILPHIDHPDRIDDSTIDEAIAWTEKERVLSAEWNRKRLLWCPK